MMHKHHIVPKRNGGSDDPSNLIEVTVEEHALLHKELWDKFGDPRDYLAWKCLSGLIGKDELVKELYILGGKISGPKLKGIPKNGKGAKGHKKSSKTKQKMKDSWLINKDKRLIHHKSHNQSGNNHWTFTKTPDTTKNINKLITCKICGKTTTAGNIARWHKHND